MHEQTFTFAGRGNGTTHALTWQSFGDPTARPHVHVQGGLHADEGPGMLAARMLADLLAVEDAAGRVRGHVTVLPAANPLGLGQVLHGDVSGRFDLYDGRNFNRGFPDLAQAAAEALDGRLGPVERANTRLIRDVLLAVVAETATPTPADALRQALLRLAIPADVVIDLHCDGEAEVHLYTQPTSLEAMLPLAALTGCRAVLVADVSGGNPFDEAVVRPWLDLARRFADHPIAPACASCTLELRGRADVCRALGARDAGAILDYLRHLGVVDGAVSLPPPACDPTPLAGSDALVAPVAGLLSYAVRLGEEVEAGQTVAEITDPVTGRVHAVRAATTGRFFARPATRIAEANKRLGKIAGPQAFRNGPLLSP